MRENGKLDETKISQIGKVVSGGTPAHEKTDFGTEMSMVYSKLTVRFGKNEISCKTKRKLLTKA
jgi:hypothetical protein